MENSYLKLKQEIQIYDSNKRKILSDSQETIDLFKKVSKHLSQEVLKCFNTEFLSISAKKFGSINATDLNASTENPSIAVIGSVKSGKSSFINTLIQKRVLPESFSTCTGRLTRLYYRRINKIKIVNSCGVVTERKSLRRRIVPENYVKLSENCRKIDNIVNSVVKVGVNIKFLKYGIDLIDTPGLGENIILTNVFKNIINEVLPIIIFVIDGRKSVRQSDITDIIEIRSLRPDLEIIYFVTKLDPDESERSSNLNDSIEISKRRMQLAFTKLQQNNLIPDSVCNWSDYPFFHGASLVQRMQYIKRHVNEESTFHQKLFSRFEESLLNCLYNYFSKKTEDACDDIINFIISVLTKIINHAQNFSNKVHENLAQIAEIKDLEEDMMEKMKKAISGSKNDLMIRLMQRLERDTDKLIDPIKEAEYPLSISIPQNGIVTDPLIIEQCQNNIRMILMQGLESVIKEFVEEELFKNYEFAVKNKWISELSQRRKIIKGYSPYQTLLENLLNKNYKVNRLSFTTSDRGNTTTEFLNVILSSLKGFLSINFLKSFDNSDNNVNNSAWKIGQAQQLIKTINVHLFAEDVCKKLIEDLEAKHRSFLDVMEEEQLFIKQELFSNNEIKVKLANTAPQFFEKLLDVVIIKGNYQFRNVKDIMKVGVGDQSFVYQSMLNGKLLARKRILLEGSKEDLQKMKSKISEEVYYSLFLFHCRILPFLGASLDQNERYISIYYPFIESNLTTYLKAKILSPKDKLKIAYQVAEGIKYLHDYDIMHRNLKAENILVDEDGNVFLSDFKLTKSEALSNYSHIGFPDHIAPEIINQGIYKKTIDIFSYGKMMCKLLNEKDKIDTRIINIAKPDFGNGKIKETIVKISSEIPECIAKLIVDCCKPKPNERPTIDFVLNVLADCM